MNKVDASRAVKITTSVARFLENTKRRRAALKFYKELVTLLEFIEQEFNSSRALMNDKTQKELDYSTISAFLSIAVINLHLLEYDESKIYAELALAKSRKTGSKKTEESCLQILCICLAFGRNQHDRNTKCLEEILSVTKESGDTETEATTYYLLALRHVDVGQMEEAEEFLEKSIQTSRKGGCRLIEVECLITLALRVLLPRQKKKAFWKLEEALRITEEIGDYERKASVLQALGDFSRSNGRFEEAKEFYEKGVQLGAKSPYARLSVYMRLGTVLIELHQFDKAMKCLQKGLDICGEDHSVGQTLQYDIYVELCRLHLLLGQPEKASEYVNKVLTGSWYEKNHTSLRVLGFYISKHGHFEQACDILAESIKGYENSLDPLNDESKLSDGDLDVNIWMYTYRCFLLFVLGKFAEALCTAEQGRARVLTELLAKEYGIQEKAKLSETDLYSLMGSLAKSQILVFFGSAADKSILWIMTNEQGPNLEVMSQEKAEVDCLLEANFGSLFCSRNVNCEDRTLSALYDIQSADDDTQHDSVSEKRLLEETDDEVREVENLPNQLFKSLIAPFADRIQGRELVLVPEGSMVMVPFAALQDDSGKYLSDSCSIRIIPSLSTLKLILDSPENYHSRNGALIVGDPQVSHVTALPQLMAARQEAKEIADLLEVEPLLGEQATKEEVLRRITDVCLVHIAAHGDAERGEIACAPNPSSPQNPTKEDYMLTMADVTKVRIRAKLVVLSCCHSAKGKIMKAEGVVGIARAFIASGARSVLVSLWAVDDKATKDFMIRFYGHVKCDKMSASEALHQTMKWMRESETTRYTVREWAPFVLIGDDVNLDL